MKFLGMSRISEWWNGLIISERRYREMDATAERWCGGLVITARMAVVLAIALCGTGVFSMLAEFNGWMEFKIADAIVMWSEMAALVAFGIATSCGVFAAVVAAIMAGLHDRVGHRPDEMEA